MTAIGTAVAGEWRVDHEAVSFGMVGVRSRWRLVSLRLLFVATLLVGCSRPPRFAPVSQADRTTVASFFGTLKHDPALFLVIRPDRLASGTAPIEKLLGSLEPAEREGLRGSLPITETVSGSSRGSLPTVYPRISKAGTSGGRFWPPSTV